MRNKKIAGATARLARQASQHPHGFGPELISQRLESWAKEKQIGLLHIQPGKPAQNAYIKRFDRTYREEVLDAYLFDSLEDVRHITEHWLEDYNTICPHEALQGLPPRQFVLQSA